LQFFTNIKNLQPLTQHAYMAYLPTVEFTGGITSASEIRSQWPRANATQRKTWAKELYPSNPAAAQQILDKYLSPDRGSLGEELSVEDKISIFELYHAKDPRYSTSLTQDVGPGAINKNLQAFDLAENDPVANTVAHLIEKYRDDIDHYQKLIADASIDSAAKPYYRKKIAELKSKIQQLWQGTYQ
jgi:hypothetical protein